MKIFITGGTGFVGKNLIKKLSASQDNEILCLTRSIKNIAFPAVNNVNFIEGDITNPETYKEFLKGVDVVYHLAGVLRHELFNRKELLKINVEGTRAFFNELKKVRPKRIIYVSTAAIFHPTKGKTVSESTPLSNKFINYYSYTKYLAYLEAKKFEKEGLPIIYILPVSIYGLGSPLFIDFISYLSREIYIAPPRESIMSLVEVEDVVDGMLLAAKKGEIGKSYILSGEDKSVVDIINAVNFRLKYKPIAINLSVSLLKSLIFILDIFSFIIRKKFYINKELFSFLYGELVASGERAKKELGWKTKDFSSSFSAMVADIIKNKSK